MNNMSTENTYEKLESIIQKFDNKENNFLFFLPEVDTPNASSYEVYFMAKTIEEAGYNVSIVVDDNYVFPTWMDSEFNELKHLKMSKINLNVGPQDILVIPEIYTNVMEQTKNLPCIRVVLLQSVDYMLNSLVPGSDWKTFGIEDVLTTSNQMSKFIKTYFGKSYNILTYTPSVPEYFTPSTKPTQPTIAIVGRNVNDITKVTKLFYKKYPHLNWITFDLMVTESNPPQPLSRKAFAEKLKKSAMAVWMDRISSYPMFAIECIKSGVIPIVLKPEITPDLIMNEDENGETTYRENCGFWTTDIYEMPMLIGETVLKYLDDRFDEEYYNKAFEVVSNITVENSKKEINEAFQQFMTNRYNAINDAIENYNVNKENI